MCHYIDTISHCRLNINLFLLLVQNYPTQKMSLFLKRHNTGIAYPHRRVVMNCCNSQRRTLVYRRSTTALHECYAASLFFALQFTQTHYYDHHCISRRISTAGLARRWPFDAAAKRFTVAGNSVCLLNGRRSTLGLAVPPCCIHCE